MDHSSPYDCSLQLEWFKIELPKSRIKLSQLILHSKTFKICVCSFSIANNNNSKKIGVWRKKLHEEIIYMRKGKKGKGNSQVQSLTTKARVRTGKQKNQNGCREKLMLHWQLDVCNPCHMVCKESVPINKQKPPSLTKIPTTHKLLEF